MDQKPPSVKIKYLMLPSRSIYNYCGGWSYLPNGELDERYPNKEFFIKKNWNNFYDRIEKDILANGFDDPIIVYAGWHRNFKRHIESIKELGIENVLTCTNTGGSRLWVAQIHDLDIPCMVNDFTDRFPNARELKTIEEIAELHTKKQPLRIHLRDDGVLFSQILIKVMNGENNERI